MRTRAQAWIIRFAVVTVVAAAGLFAVTTPAHAAPLIVNFTLSTTIIDPGQQVTATWTVRTTGEEETVDVSISSNNPQVQCNGGQCSVGNAVIAAGNGTDFSATFVANGVFATQQTVQIRVQAGNVQSNPVNLTVRATPTVPEVKGTVTDLNTGEPIKDARVSMTDSAGTQWDNIGTADDGSFTITSTPQKPITAGQLRFTVTKEGLEPFQSGAIPAAANQPLTNVSLRVMPIPSSATPTSLPPITASGLATETPGGETSAAPPADGGLSGFSIMLIVLGSLLVLVGIAAIVFLFLRRNDDEDGPPRGPMGPGGPGMGGRGGPGRGGPPPPGPRRPGSPPDRTQLMRPGYGPPRPGAPGSRDQTMIARSPLADAPTQMHGRPGAPQPPYSGPPAYPQQQPPPPHGGPAPGGPPPQGGWAPPGGYGQQPGHGGPPAGYPQQQTYGGQPGYGQPRPGGYDDRPGGRPAPEGRRVDWMDD